jgi:SAM-dependent methyltransferase
MCDAGHKYSLIDDIPVLLREGVPCTIGIMKASYEAARTKKGAPLYLETLGLVPAEKDGIAQAFARGETSPDPVVSWLVGATSGLGYAHSIGKLTTYPIPALPLEDGGGRALLDLGCNWGRWSIAAARKGWSVTGIDPSLGALLAARRVAKELGLKIQFICADARYLPFADHMFAQVFSYSVLQHFSYKDAEQAFREIARVVKHAGAAKLQLAHCFGARALYHQARRGFGPNREFGVRYWTIPRLREAFETAMGPTKIIAEAFGGLGLLYSDRDHLTATGRVTVTVSEGLRRLSQVVSPLIWVADSLYVESVKR